MRANKGPRTLQTVSDARYAVVAEQQCAQARERREALQARDDVVCQVDAVELVLRTWLGHGRALPHLTAAQLGRHAAR